MDAKEEICQLKFTTGQVEPSQEFDFSLNPCQGKQDPSDAVTVDYLCFDSLSKDLEVVDVTAGGTSILPSSSRNFNSPLMIQLLPATFRVPRPDRLLRVKIRNCSGVSQSYLGTLIFHPATSAGEGREEDRPESGGEQGGSWSRDAEVAFVTGEVPPGHSVSVSVRVDCVLDALGLAVAEKVELLGQGGRVEGDLAGEEGFCPHLIDGEGRLNPTCFVAAGDEVRFAVRNLTDSPRRFSGRLRVKTIDVRRLVRGALDEVARPVEEHFEALSGMKRRFTEYLVDRSARWFAGGFRRGIASARLADDRAEKAELGPRGVLEKLLAAGLEVVDSVASSVKIYREFARAKKAGADAACHVDGGPEAPGEDARLLEYPLGPVVVEAEETRDVECCVAGPSVGSEEVFRMVRLVFDDTCALNFAVLDILVDGRSQIATTDGLEVPAVVFSSESGRTGAGDLECDPCPPGRSVVVRVRNTTQEPRLFAGKICGRNEPVVQTV